MAWKRIGDGWSDITLHLDNEDAELLHDFLCLAEYPSNGPNFRAVQKAKVRVAPRLRELLSE